MKATGITRKIDELGRIVLPIELRRKFNIEYKDTIDIYTEDNKIILKKDDSSPSAGIIRKIDELGRVVLPVELRKKFGIEIKDSIDIYIEEDRIILKKYETSCIFCGEAEDVVQFKGKNICPDCINEIIKKLG